MSVSGTESERCQWPILQDDIFTREIWLFSCRRRCIHEPRTMAGKVNGVKIYAIWTARNKSNLKRVFAIIVICKTLWFLPFRLRKAWISFNHTSLLFLMLQENEKITEWKKGEDGTGVDLNFSIVLWWHLPFKPETAFVVHVLFTYI